MICFSGKARFRMRSRCALYRNVELEPALAIVRRNGHQAKGVTDATTARLEIPPQKRERLRSKPRVWTTISAQPQLPPDCARAHETFEQFDIDQARKRKSASFAQSSVVSAHLSDAPITRRNVSRQWSIWLKRRAQERRSRDSGPSRSNHHVPWAVPTTAGQNDLLLIVRARRHACTRRMATGDN
jgi:hypothetical protein